MNAPHDEDAGFSLMETVIAMIIFALVAVATAGVLIRSATLTSDNRGRATASKLAAAQMDALRGDQYSDLESDSQTVTRSGKAFTMNTLITPVFDDGSGGVRACTAGGVGGELYKRVSVTVAWQNTSQVQQIRNDTIIQNPGTSVDSTKGALAVTVMDSGVGKSAPEPVAQQAVTFGSQTRLTDDSGCAFFDNLTPVSGQTVTVNNPGWIDNTNKAPATKTVGVQAGLIAATSITYDKAVSIATTFAPTGQTPGDYKIPSGVKYTIVPQLSLNDTTLRSPVAISAPSGTTIQRFPQDSGYAVWTGTCEPAVADVTTVDDTIPGASLTKNVAMGGVTVTNSQAGSRTIFFVNQASGCTEYYSTTIAAGIGTQTKIALPYGTWKYGGSLASLIGSSFTVTNSTPLRSVTW